MLGSYLFSQDAPSNEMKVNWTADLVLGKGYTITKTYSVDDVNYVICYNADSKKTQIWNLKEGGQPVYDKSTHAGWTSIVFFKLNTKTYMFSYKKASGEVIFFEMTKTGIGKRVGEYKWSTDWTEFDVFYNNNKPTIIMTRASDGRAKFFEPLL